MKPNPRDPWLLTLADRLPLALVVFLVLALYLGMGWLVWVG